MIHSEEHQMLVDTLTDIAENELAEHAFEWQGDHPQASIDVLADRGFLGINFDEEYGGGGMTEYEAVLMNEVIGRTCPDTAAYLTSVHFIGPRTVDMFGTDHAKAEYLPPVIDGEEYIAIGISEPEAGSDINSMNTTIRDEGDRFVVNGEKTWVSRVPESRAAVIWGRFPGEGIGAVIMDFDRTGVELTQEFTNMAGNTQVQFFMEDVSVPKENVLNRGKEGFKNQLQALNWERLGVAAVMNAISYNAIEKSLDYAEQRVQFDQPIIDFQGIEWKVADMVKQLEVSRAINHKAAEEAYDRGRVPEPLIATISSLFATEVADKIVDEALQIHGSNGYQRGHPMEYLYRLVRGYRIGGGTDEILKNTIARRVKNNGLPSLY